MPKTNEDAKPEFDLAAVVPPPEENRERRQRLLAKLARAVSLSELEQVVRRLRPQVQKS